MGDPIQVLGVLFTALSNSTYAVMVGVLLAGHWLAGSKATPVRTLRRLGVASVAMLILCHLVHLWFVAASMTGASRFDEVLGAIPMVLSATRQGTLWYANSAILAALLVAAIMNSPGTQAMLVCLLAAAKAASGHAAGQGDFTLVEFSQWLHLAATAVWAGAVIVSGLLVAPRLAGAGLDGLWRYGKRLSGVVTWALLALFVSGIYTSDRELNGGWRALWTSAWGRILLVKLALVLIAVGLGALSRFRCLGRPAADGRAALMVTLLRVEAAAMIVVLALSALLASTAPAAAAL